MIPLKYNEHYAITSVWQTDSEKSLISKCLECNKAANKSYLNFEYL